MVDYMYSVAHFAVLFQMFVSAIAPNLHHLQDYMEMVVVCVRAHLLVLECPYIDTIATILRCPGKYWKPIACLCTLCLLRLE